MNLSLYNTKSRSVEEFKPLNEGVVTMYACGPTVYDYTHIGHMRKYIGDDILRRTLALLGYSVTHVMNITDVGHLTNDSDQGDDKFEAKARSAGKSVWDIAALYTDYFHKTMESVNVLPPHHETKATDHIKEMTALVEVLMAKGFAYETTQAIYFDVAKDAEYGKLSGQKVADKFEGVREDVVVDTDKKHPADFAVWFKCVGKFADHTMHWPNPNNIEGEGFPGWHIECSAMAMNYLGETIDIHTGGIDHIPVHHENEIAQSECATGHEFVRFWVHHEFLHVNGEKMSKSKHNFYTLQDIEGHNIDPIAMRLLCMQTSYRKPLNFTWDSLVAADAQLKKLQKFASTQSSLGLIHTDSLTAFTEALTDDLNTARAMAVVWEMLGDPLLSPADKWSTLLAIDTVLGLNLADVEKFVITDSARTLASKRDEARAAKNYTLSDTLRKELEDLGYSVLDTPNGTVLE